MAERHAKIFTAWKGLGEGDFLIIKNDHDPKPLQYLLKAEFKDPFNWKLRR